MGRNLGKNTDLILCKKGNKDNSPFKFEDIDNLTATKMEIGFTPLDLSAFPGYLDELHEVSFHAFKGDHDNDVHHVEWFMNRDS